MTTSGSDRDDPRRGTDARRRTAPHRRTDPRREIPATHTLLSDPRLAGALAEVGRESVKAAIRQVQRRLRHHTPDDVPDDLPDDVPDKEPDRVPDRLPDDGAPTRACTDREPAHGTQAEQDLVEVVLRTLAEQRRGPVPVLNATGVLVHTNLGRAPLSEAARDALRSAAGCTDVEFDLATGVRAARGRGALAALADRVPDAEDVHIVNNNAAALLLCALELANGKEILLSRGQFVEIGDGFRVPELLASSGARIREVGTTNRTHLPDYERAIGPDTGFLLLVHTSNFRVTGFTSEVPVGELAELGARRGVPVVTDIGSGLLTPHPVLPQEPDATSALRAGAALVTASADKLLGGPQAGLILGRADLVRRLRRHPAARALRVDKLTLAALEATLRNPDTPVDIALRTDDRSLAVRAERLVEHLRARLPDETVRMVRCESVVGGGGAPEVRLPSHGVDLPEPYAAALRTGNPAVVGRVAGGRCVLDLRTVRPDADDQLAAAVTATAARLARLACG